jgi:hypothetical protein
MPECRVWLPHPTIQTVCPWFEPGQPLSTLFRQAPTLPLTLDLWNELASAHSTVAAITRTSARRGSVPPTRSNSRSCKPAIEQIGSPLAVRQSHRGKGYRLPPVRSGRWTELILITLPGCLTCMRCFTNACVAKNAPMRFGLSRRS